MRFGSRSPRGGQITPIFSRLELRLFEGAAYLKEAFIWKSEGTKNCIDISIFTFRIKLTELTSLITPGPRRLFAGGA